MLEEDNLVSDRPKRKCTERISILDYEEEHYGWMSDEDDDDFSLSGKRSGSRSRKRSKPRPRLQTIPKEYQKGPVYERILSLREEVEEVKKKIQRLRTEVRVELSRLNDARLLQYDCPNAPSHCVPIRADVRGFDWNALGKTCRFDVVMMDPPWQLASANPTRGVALGYNQLPNTEIEEIPIAKVQDAGLLFIWVINSRYQFALDLFRRWGYKLVDDITWVKRTSNRRLAKGHGYYLQHAKETCLVGMKGQDDELSSRCNAGDASDVIYSERRGQSQKPEEIYEYIEALMPGGRYLEIFARKNNLRDGWVSVGLEL